MYTAALVALLLLGQAPVAPTATATSLEADLTRLERWADPKKALPDVASLKRALGIDDVRVPSLRERANALRVELATLSRPAPTSLDGGTLDGGVGSDAGVGPSGEERLLRGQLAVLERVIAAELEATQAAIQRRLDEEQAARRRAEEEARRAEDAQQRALEEARNARSTLLERGYARVAEIEGLNATIAGHRAELHDRSAALLAEVRQAGEDAAKLLAVARAPKGGDADADALLKEVLSKQRALLEGVGEALELRERIPDQLADVDVARRAALDDAAQLTGALGSAERGDVERAIEALRSVVASLEHELDVLREETSERWYRVAERRLDVAGLLDDARLALLSRVSSDMRSRLHGLSNDGAENLAVALRHVGWRLRFHVVRRAHDARHLDEQLSDGIQLGKVLWALSLAIFALMLSTWLWRRAPSLFVRVKKAALKSAQSPAYARFVASWLSLLEAVAQRSFLIVLALWLHGVLTAIAPEPELTIVVEGLVWVLSYQLASRLLHMLILRLARRRLSLTVLQKLRILRSVRLVLRYGFVVAYLLGVMRDLVGHGVLYQGVRLVAFAFAVPILAVLVQRWRDDIATAYLAHQPDSRLARVVEHARGEWYGFFVAVAAFGVVAGHGIGVLGRDFVLGFEQSRKALAYLFRLRIERQAQRRGLSPVDVSELPEVVREAFDDRPAEDDALLVDRFDDVARASDAVRRFPEGHGSLLVHSPWGMGRTTWLLRLAREIDDDKRVLWWRPSSRIVTAEHLLASLGGVVGCDEPPSSLRQLAAQLCDAGPRVVFLDGTEQLFLRAVEGYTAIETLTELMDETRGHVFWVLSAPTPAYRHLCQTRFFDQHLGGEVHLGRWSESEIRELIQRRQRSSGIDASFEDLIVHDVEGDRLPTQVVETEEGYIRLLWNFAEGNPRVAQLFWLRSLYKTAGGQLRVRLYSAPSADDLEPLSERDRFVLSAVHLHGALTAEDAARACRLPEPAVHAHLARGIAMGLYTKTAGGSAYAVSLTWWEATLRYLRRKNLLM